jgi:hypothetical protein
MSIRRILLIALAASGVILAVGTGPRPAGSALALPPAQERHPPGVTIPYPGRLSDDAGHPAADGAYGLTFARYDAETGGEPLWSEVQEGAAVHTAANSATPDACTRYVATDGDDGNPGTQAQPWATFQHAADTYYVRLDGGSATQCTGRANAPYPGSGTDQPCAWDHPFRALEPSGELGEPGTVRIAGGDTLVIASGSYRMGYGAPGAGNCQSDYPWDCHMPPIPSGPDPAHPTRILGEGWEGGCANPPELWGAERAAYVLNLTDASNVEIACLEITDHSGCVEDHTGGLACERDTYPYGDWAVDGLYAEDSASIHLRDVNIHGLAAAGIRAGRLSNWTVENVRLVGNGWIGWEGDIDGNDSNSGTMLFRHWTVEWNGCGETHPGEQPVGCWDENVGGYGDGVGTGATGGTWIIEDSDILHNTSDGLDLLYHQLGGRVVINRVRAEGNAGNQIKVAGQAVITNSVLVGNCAFFEGKSYTYHVNPCRAEGNTLAVAYTGGEGVSIVNSTFYGQGDGLVGGGPREGYSCTGAETLTARNSIFLGDEEFGNPGDISFLFYQEGCADLELDSDYNLAHSVKNIECGINGVYVNSGAHDLCQDPQLSGPFSGNAYGMTPTSGSPAIDTGDNAVCPSVDILGTARPIDGDENGSAICDRGAYERWVPDAWVYLPVALKQ